MGRSGGHKSGRASATMPVREKRTPLDVRTLDDYAIGRGIQLPIEGTPANGATEIGDGLIQFRDEAELRRQRTRLLRQMRKAVDVKPMAWFNGASDLINGPMVAGLDLKFAFQHAMTGQHVQKTAFEAIMFESFLEQGTSAFMPEDRTNRGFDLLVADRVRLSLKTEKSKTIQPHQLTVSKLMEAAWCKEIRTRPDVARLLPNILEHLDTWDRMLVLRANKLPKRNGWVYELLEIEKDLFWPLQEMDATSFSVPTAKHRSVAHVDFDGQRMYTLVVDGSVGKITLANLHTPLCPVHAIWHLPETSRGVLRPRAAVKPALNPQVRKPQELKAPTPLEAPSQDRFSGQGLLARGPLGIGRQMGSRPTIS